MTWLACLGRGGGGTVEVGGGSLGWGTGGGRHLATVDNNVVCWTHPL